MFFLFVVIFQVLSFAPRTWAVPFDDFNEKKEQYLTQAKSNIQIWSSAKKCAEKAKNNDQLLSCKKSTSEERKAFWKNIRETKLKAQASFKANPKNQK